MPVFNRSDQVGLRERSFLTADKHRDIPSYIPHLRQDVQYTIVMCWKWSLGTRIWYKHVFTIIAIDGYAKIVRLPNMRRNLESQSAETVRALNQSVKTH